MKLKTVIFSLISIAIVAITGILLYVYWPAITGTISNSSYLTPEQGQSMYDKGYEDGNKSAEEQLAQISYYKELTDEYYTQVNFLNEEINNLNGVIASNNDTIIQLTNIKNTNLQTITDLNMSISTYEITISSLNTQINELQREKTNLETEVSSLNSSVSDKQSMIDSLLNEIVNLENTIADNNDTIVNLNSQVSVLNTHVNNLQSEITLKSNTISSLNNQILNLQETCDIYGQIQQSYINTISSLYARNEYLSNQISSLTLRMQTIDKTMFNYIERINDLQNTIKQYELFIDSLELNTQCIATFEYDGAIINIQIVNINDLVSIQDPVSTNYKVFNGWTVNGVLVDLEEYNITEDTKFIADITYYYDVKYILFGENIKTELVMSGNFSTVPSGFTSPRIIEYSNESYAFSGWTIDDKNLIDVSNFRIIEDTTFIAKLTRQISINFLVDDTLKNAFNLGYNPNGNSIQFVKTVNRGYLKDFVPIPVAEYSSDGYLVRINNSACSNMVNQVYCRLNGWKLNGTIVDLNSYILAEEDLVFEADIEYANVVIFKNGYNGAIIKKEYLFSGNTTIAPALPNDGYDYYFDGWITAGVNGILTDNDISHYEITSDIIFVTNYLPKYKISFNFNDNIIRTELELSSNNIFVYATPNNLSDFNFKNENFVKINLNNGQISSVYIPNNGTKELTSISRFNGFKINGGIVNIDSDDLTKYATQNRIISITVDIERALSISFINKSTNEELLPKKYVYRGELVGEMPVLPDTETTYFAGWSYPFSPVIDFSTVTLVQNINVNPVFYNKAFVRFNLFNLSSYLNLDDNYVSIYYSPTEINNLSFREEKFVKLIFVEGSNVLIDKIVLNGKIYNVNGEYSFGGWKVNNEIVDIYTYLINGNVYFNGAFSRV